MNLANKINTFTNAVRIYKVIERAKGEVRFIGGCVRDALLNRPITDIDLATNLKPEQVKQALSDSGIHYINVGAAFGTITAILNKEKIEITSLRKDLSCNGRHAIVEFTNNWQEDAQRRDFTINALSVDLKGNIFDYFNGLEDLQDAKVKFIGIAEERICEDYLRILRFFRFSSDYAQSIDPEGLLAAKKHAYMLKNISPNRIHSELSKIFVGSQAVKVIAEMKSVLPEILPCKHNAVEDLLKLYKLIQKFNVNCSATVCYAALIKNSEDFTNFYEKFVFTKNELKTLKILLSSKIENWSYNNLKLLWSKYKNLFKEMLIINLINHELDSLLTVKIKRLFSQEIKALPITGRDLVKLGIDPDKDMGKLLIMAEQIWFESEFKINKDELLKKIYEHKN